MKRITFYASLIGTVIVCLIMVQRGWWMPICTNLLTVIGALCNVSACYFNGGKMPAVNINEEIECHQPMTEHTRLKPLCDIVMVKCRGKAAAYSIGDIVMVAGFILGFLAVIFS